MWWDEGSERHDMSLERNCGRVVYRGLFFSCPVRLISSIAECVSRLEQEKAVTKYPVSELLIYSMLWFCFLC